MLNKYRFHWDDGTYNDAFGRTALEALLTLGLLIAKKYLGHWEVIDEE